MGPGAGKRCERWIASVLGAGHGSPHKIKIQVNKQLFYYLLSLIWIELRQPGQGSSAEVGKRDLRAELLAAEAEVKEKKRKALGLPPIVVDEPMGDEETNKRRKLLQQAIEAEQEENSGEETVDVKGKGKEKATNGTANGDGQGAEEEEEEEEDSEEEDDTEELLRELEKIKRERAAEKEK